MPRILVIDDSPAALETVAMMLTAAGHEVRCCRDGKRARQMVDRESFDLILTDIYMPEEDGLQVIAQNRRRNPNVPIVAMSGASGALDMSRVARLLGACQLLKKPFSNAELADAIGAALQSEAPAEQVGLPKRT